ncbi:Fe-S cluster assembly protein SufD [Planctomycetota bacterium]|nr:Fe-S cluster assembly protein SufD [Planctomycetota bacterium]
MTTQTANNFAAAFEAAKTSTDLDWLVELREEAATSVEALGLPTQRHEEWRWTNLKRIRETQWQLSENADITPEQVKPFLIDDADDYRIVFVNGHFAPKLSKIGTQATGIRVTTLQSAAIDDPHMSEQFARFADHHAQPFTGINTATVKDGTWITVPAKLKHSQPIHVLYLTTGKGISSPRTFIRVGELAEVDVIESFVGLDDSERLVTAVTELTTSAGAKVRHVKILDEKPLANVVHWNEVRVERNSDVRCNAINLAAGLARNNVNVMLRGEGGNCHVNGLTLGRDSEHIDNHVLIDHIKPHCSSDQLYRAVVNDKARSVFSGKIIVRNSGGGADAHQNSNNLLLSDSAHVDTKPQLEIYTDDVKCSHGATSGQLDKDAIFFLRSRGLNEDAARNLLTYAFANDVIEHIKVDAARKHLETLLEGRFEGLIG